MAGRRPMPSALKLISGNPGKRPITPDTVFPIARQMDKPETLSPVAGELWDDLVPRLLEVSLLTDLDVVALEMLCEAYADYCLAAEVIAREGITYEVFSQSGTNSRRQNPAVAMKSDADRRIRAWLVEFGMTPSSRAKVSRAEEKEEDPAQDYLT